MRILKTILLRLIYYLLFLNMKLERNYKKGKIKKIMIVQDSGIGNMVLLTPLLKNLRKNFPQEEIILIEGKNKASELIERELVNRIIQYPSNFINKLNLTLKLRKEKIDLVLISFLNSNYEMAIFSYLIGAKIRVGYNSLKYAYGKGCGLLYNVKVRLPEITEDRDEIERHLDLLRALKIPVIYKEPKIYITEEDRKWARDFLKKHGVKEEDKLVGIHPGAGKEMRFKCWPIEKFINLIKKLKEIKNVEVLIVGGEGERDLAEIVKRSINNKVLFSVGKATIRETSALIEKCSLFISNDSGPMNIAFALRIPLIAIFGPTQIPFSLNKKTLVIRENFPCMPCYRFKEISCPHRKCLTSITVEEVFEKVRRFL